MIIQFCMSRCGRRSALHTVKQTIRCFSSTNQQLSQQHVSPLTSCSELNEQMQQPDWHQKIRVLDARWDLDDGDYHALHMDNRIPCSNFFSFEKCRDVTSPFPRMLPSESEFSDYVTELGIGNEHHVVVYDDHEKFGLYSSPRVWWMFRIFGHQKVSVLDGGFRKWLSDGYPTISGSYTKEEKSLPKPSKSFSAFFHPTKVKDFKIIRKNAVSTDPVQVIDARGGTRFVEGHIPKSFSMPFTEIFQTDRTVLSKKELTYIFTSKNIDLSKDVISSCGSGITAAVLSLALFHTCDIDSPIYDGSWSEWKVRAPHMISSIGKKV